MGTDERWRFAIEAPSIKETFRL